MQNKTEILDLLHNNVCSVVFEKTNGDVRTMQATLVKDYINYESKGSGRSDPEDVVTVWDVQADGFRRFKISKLLAKVKPLA